MYDLGLPAVIETNLKSKLFTRTDKHKYRPVNYTKLNVWSNMYMIYKNYDWSDFLKITGAIKKKQTNKQKTFS